MVLLAAPFLMTLAHQEHSMSTSQSVYLHFPDEPQTQDIYTNALTAAGHALAYMASQCTHKFQPISHKAVCCGQTNCRHHCIRKHQPHETQFSHFPQLLCHQRSILQAIMLLKKCVPTSSLCLLKQARARHAQSELSGCMQAFWDQSEAVGHFQ